MILPEERKERTNKKKTYSMIFSEVHIKDSIYNLIQEISTNCHFNYQLINARVLGIQKKY